MDRIDNMKAFVTVAEEGSFTKAANKLNMSSQLISKYVSHFEEYLGTRLFNRTTRRVHLTDEGEQCFLHAKQILESITAMESHFGQLQQSVNGVLHISAPVSFSTLHLPPLLRDFKKAYPDVGIDLQLSDRKIDIVDEGLDVALRIGHLKDSSLIAKKVATVRLVLCASPDYLALNGTPTHPQELNPLHFLRYSYIEYNQPHLPLMQALKPNMHSNNPSGLCANNGEILMNAAIAGEGYTLQPTFIVGEALKQGKLVTLLDAFEPDTMGLYVVYPHRKLLAPKLRVFVDFISDYYGAFPYWDNF
ncbi:LysR family transcriptional regulator [Algibacillus agarilyticus]|uniref:LysR family transcriptional regulator n=1 Tax=Algibacillus agarilyticus TaxID=2234133 RepID=UPI000DD03B3F|nr:LysR family transcriptional regulator [Algibacillus agarilyticus]